MVRYRRFVTIPALAAAALLLASGLAGCSNTRFGSQLSVQPRPQPISAAAGTTLRLPQDKAFSIALPSANREPGLGGTAEADADATGAGTAEASAAIADSGTAAGLFQLGHSFENDTSRQADFKFTVRYHYAFEAAATPESGYPDAVVGLKLYARGQRGRLLQDLSLIQHSTDSGSLERAGEEALHFTLTLGPDEVVTVFLAGQVKVEIREGRSAHGALKLRDVQMEVVTKPAPATGDEQ